MENYPQDSHVDCIILLTNELVGYDLFSLNFVTVGQDKKITVTVRQDKKMDTEGEDVGRSEQDKKMDTEGEDG